jgi:serine/threonine protein kinase
MNKYKQSAGQLLGEGGYGCVVSPPLKCKNHFNNIPYSIDNKFISKLVEYDPENDLEIMNELKIGSKITKLDQNQKYFSPIINGCHFYKQKSNDIKYEKYKPYDNHNDDTDYYNGYNDYYDDYESDELNYQNHIPKTQCNIYTNEKYLNLISKNAGISLDDGLKDVNISNFLRKNYINVFKHLCDGLAILHKNNILHRDIKVENMMIKYNKTNNKARITYIDFGLSVELKEKYKISELNDMTYFGTDLYKPIEIIIINMMLDNLKKNRYHESKNFAKEVIINSINEFKAIYQDIILYYKCEDSKFIYNIQKFKDMKKSGKYDFKDKIINIFSYLYNDYHNDILFKKLINDPKFIFKWDVFSLGLVFAQIMTDLNIVDIKANALINKMTNIYYWDRYTIEDCLKDPFFTARSILNDTKL